MSSSEYFLVKTVHFHIKSALLDFGSYKYIIILIHSFTISMFYRKAIWQINYQWNKPKNCLYL